MTGIVFLIIGVSLLIGFIFCGVMAWRAGQPAWTDTPKEAAARKATNKKLGL